MAGRRALSVVLFLMCVTAPWLVPQPERAERIQRVCDCAKPQHHDSRSDWSSHRDSTWNM
jgi:hypothetical protein